MNQEIETALKKDREEGVALLKGLTDKYDELAMLYRESGNEYLAKRFSTIALGMFIGYKAIEDRS